MKSGLFRLIMTAAAVLACSPRAAHAYPGEAYLLSREALQQYEDGNFDKAEELYRRAVDSLDNPPPQINIGLGGAAYRGGKSDEATSAFRSAYDPSQPFVNAAARYNAGVVEHMNAIKDVQDLLDASEPPVPLPEERQAQVEAAITALEKCCEDYRKAMLDDPSDRQMKFNHEVARKQIDKLREMITPPPQGQDQQQDPQQNENQDQQQQNQQQSPGQNDEQQNPGNEGNEGEEQQGEQPPPPQSSPQDSEGEEGDESEDSKSDKGEQEEDKTGSEGDPDKQDEKPAENSGQEESPAEPDKPEPADQKPQDGKPQPGQGQPQQGTGSPADARPEPKPGEMSKADVERLLNSLPDDDPAVLQRLFNARYQTVGDMEKDW